MSHYRIFRDPEHAGCFLRAARIIVEVPMKKDYRFWALVRCDRVGNIEPNTVPEVVLNTQATNREDFEHHLMEINNLTIVETIRV